MKHKKIFLLLFTIISVGLLSGFFVSYAENISFTNLAEPIPVPEKSENFWPGRQIVELNNTETQMYYYANELYPPEKIIEFYKNYFPTIGWQLKDYWQLMRVAHFEKDARHIYIGVTELKGGSKLFIIYSKEPVHVCLNYSSISTKDVIPDRPGRDIPIIPRMPGSVRLTSVIRKDPAGMPLEALFVYATKDDMVKITNFYKSQLGTGGWNCITEFLAPALPNSVQSAQESSAVKMGGQKTGSSNLYVAATLKFKKGKDMILVSSYYCPDSDANIIIITFNFLGAGIPFNFGAGW